MNNAQDKTQRYVVAGVLLMIINQRGVRCGGDELGNGICQVVNPADRKFLFGITSNGDGCGGRCGPALWCQTASEDE